MAVEFKYNDEGVLETWKDGKKIGSVTSMGDMVWKKVDSDIARFRKRRKDRLDARMDADEDGRWVTTEEKHKIHINENGEIDKGNPYLLKAIKENPKSTAQIGRKKVERVVKRFGKAYETYERASSENKKLRDKYWEIGSEYRTGERRRDSYYRNKKLMKEWGVADKTVAELNREKRKYERYKEKLEDGKLEKSIRDKMYEEWQNEERKKAKSELESGKSTQEWYDYITKEYIDSEKSDSRKDSLAKERIDGYINQYRFYASTKKHIDGYNGKKFDELEKKYTEAKKKYDESNKKLESARRAMQSEASRRNVDKIRFLDDESRKSIVDDTLKSRITGHMDEDQKKKLADSLNNASDLQLSILSKTNTRANVMEIPDGEACSHYKPGTGGLFIEKSDMGNPRVIWHEFGHFLDDGEISGMDNIDKSEYSNTLSRDLEKNRVVHGDESAKDLNKMFDDSFPGKYTVVAPEEGYSLIKIKDNETGEFLDSGAVMVLTFDISEKCINGYLKKPIREYEKSVGVPDQVKYDDYFETYTTPKRKITREREKFKGANEAYTKALIEREEAMDRVREKHPDYDAKMSELWRQEGENEQRIAPISDMICAMLHGRFASIYGSHSEEYYRQGSHAQNECVADYHQMRVMNDTYALNALNEIAPNFAKKMKERYDLWMLRNLKL